MNTHPYNKPFPAGIHPFTDASQAPAGEACNGMIFSELPKRIQNRILKHEGGCWIWSGWLNHKGYGLTRYNGRTVRVHRFIYEWFTGTIIGGLTIDHLCKNASCCNPAHLEAVTMRENILRSDGPAAINARKTHCKNGHELTGNNIRLNRGERICRVCYRRPTPAA